MELKICPSCNGSRRLSDGSVCKRCIRGMIVICKDCGIEVTDKGFLSSNHSEMGISEYRLFQCPNCKVVESIDTYSKNWYDLIE